MKKLLIYYSLTGNLDMVADLIVEKGYELRKVIEQKKMSKVTFFRILGGGFRAGMRKRGKLIDYNNDVSEYDEIIIGSPVWNGRTPPAINSVLDLTDLKDKKLTFLFSSGSGKMPKDQKRLLKLYPNAEFINLKEPKSHQEELEKIKEL